MKLLPILLLNVVTVGAGIVIYDQLRDDSAPVSYGDVGATDAGVLERLDALEQARSESTPMLQAEGADPRLLARVEDLEKRLGGPARGAVPVAGGGDPVREAPGMAAPQGAPASEGDEPSDAEVERHMKLTERARELERLRREQRRIDQTLANLEIELSPKQKDLLYKANRDFSERRNEIFRESFAKARESREAGADVDMGEIMRETRQAVQDEFTIKISSFIPEGDAQKISASLNTRGGNMRSGVMGGRGRGR